MKRVIVQYGVPADPAAFNKHYEETHIPLVKKMPRLKGFEYSSGAVVSSDEDAAYHFVAILSYDSQEDLEFSLGSPEGIAAVEDVGNFASGGVEIITVDVVKAI